VYLPKRGEATNEALEASMADPHALRRDDGPARADRRQRLIIAAAALAVLLACVAGAWWAVVAASGAGDVALDRTETLALKARWQASFDAIVPIAKDFASSTAGGAIDVAAYRGRIEAARAVVDSISDVPVTIPENRQVRDSMLSGASAVLDGMDALLQAASTDDTPGVETAATAIDSGTTTLKEAGAALDAKIAAKGWR
jgi:hypothetical protein